MKKVIFTLNIGNYAPEITALTYPYIRKYAEKIGADFRIISERKFPDFPVTYEKLQIYELSKGYDWAIYIDSDAIIHPDMFDVTEFLNVDTVSHCGNDMANNRWRYDKYFKRDGRNIGSCNWFTVASSLCFDLWKPLDDLTLDEALSNIFPLQVERNINMKPEHLIDDYVLSRNIAKYGLKFKNLNEIIMLQGFGQNVNFYFLHNHLISEDKKVECLKNIINEWKI